MLTNGSSYSGAAPPLTLALGPLSEATGAKKQRPAPESLAARGTGLEVLPDRKKTRSVSSPGCRPPSSAGGGRGWTRSTRSPSAAWQSWLGRAVDPWLCVPVFRRVCPYRDTISDLSKERRPEMPASAIPVAISRGVPQCGSDSEIDLGGRMGDLGGPPDKPASGGLGGLERLSALLFEGALQLVGPGDLARLGAA